MPTTVVMHGPAPPPLNEAADDMSGTYKWVIKDWSKIRTPKLRSESFTIGGFNWRILIFPKGNSCDFLSVYLDVADPELQPYGWSRFAQFSLTVVSQVDEKYNVKKDTSHTFEGRESDWGFTQFVTLSDINDPSKGYLVDDAVIVQCDVNVRKEYSPYHYDSRKETGFIGLKNQGATCYMNSLLQTLFHIPYFRKAVYHMPTTESDSPHNSIPLALQSIFYKLQFAENAVATKDLTRSFGWDAYDSFMQHDVQELNRVLCEKLEEKMKATSVEGTIQKLFQGHVVNYINCVDVDYKSTRKEEFLDLQLNVKGCIDVYASFDKYVEVEKMDGENKYRAEGYGLQDAEKGVLFDDFPPVLQLQLKRFEYDFQRDTMVKINDRYEFPEVLDLDAGNGKYLSPQADRSVRNKYLLHSVLVHSGGVNGGHYYAYIRPDLRGKWFKFDDERVTKEETARALNDQYGGDDDNLNPGYNPAVTPGLKLPKYSNAYMLVYVRESDMAQIVCDATEEDIAEHLKVRLKKEQEEKERKRKEKAQAHLYTVIKLATMEDLSKQIGNDIHFDLVDHEKCRRFRVEKQTPFADFKRQVAAELGVPVERQRYWLWAKRQNQTLRPNRALSQEDEMLTVSQVRDQAVTSSKTPSIASDLNILLEVVSDAEAAAGAAKLSIVPMVDDDFPARAVSGGAAAQCLTSPPAVPKGHAFLFFKFYNPRTETLCYVGHLLLDKGSRMIDNKDAIIQLAAAGLHPGEDIVLFEEIKYDPAILCEQIEWHSSLSEMQIGHGDIVVIQPIIPQSAVHKGEVRHASVPEYMEYIRNRQRVIFRELASPRDDKLLLDLSMSMTYDAVTAKLAEALNVKDPSTIRLTTHNDYSQAPKLPSLAYRGVEALSDMLTQFSNNTSDILYYEVLDMPLPELERLKSLKISFHGRDTSHVETFNIRMPRDCCVADALTELRAKLGDKVTPGRELRLLELFYSKIYKVFSGSEKIEGIDDQYWTLRAEEVIPEENGEVESAAGEGSVGTPGTGGGAGDKLIHVYHFCRDGGNQGNQGNPQVHNFGDPFLLRVGAEEPLSSVKRRVQAKLGLPDDEFDKWKWAYHSLGRPEYLADSDIVAAKFIRRDTLSAYENYLGLEHEDKNPMKTAAKNNNRYGGYDQKPVKIYN